ncbi:MAG TPA: ferrochelatase [Sulfurovum sp. UBA12169]|nr:MAG TPA: ferrochelatase [Sulfurovum sp. UBA12169]
MKQALFLLNMGGPSNIPEVKLFLQNMFSDKNILPVNPLARKLIGTIIVKKRLHEAEENYQALGGKSPLLELTIKLIEKLQSKLNMPIYPAMRYVPPFATESLEKCKEEGIEELILFPLYPQYSTTTTLSSYEDIQERCSALGYAPKLTLIDPYYDEYEYIEASCEKILEAIDGKESKLYDLLLSAHGLPVSIIEAGDPYQRHVEANVSAIKIYLKAKGIEFNSIKLVYQSKVGPSAWLEPSLADILRNPTNKKVVIYPLAFTIDNSETVYELGIEHAEIARKIKYEDYKVASCMNDSDKFVEFIVQKVKLAQGNYSKTEKTR